MDRNLTRAGSNMDSRRKSSGGLLGNFPRKSSAVLNSAQRRGVANTPDKGVSGGGQGPGQGTGSIRRSGGENKAPFAGGGGTGGSSGGTNPTEKNHSTPQDSHHGEALDASRGRTPPQQVLHQSSISINTSLDQFLCLWVIRSPINAYQCTIGSIVHTSTPLKLFLHIG